MLPISYRVIEDRRAQDLSISVRGGQVLITLPPGTDQSIIAPLLERHRKKIERALAGQKKEDGPPLLPETISLTAIDERWRVLYRHVASDEVRCVGQERTLDVSGLVDREVLTCAVLQGWLKEKARRHLTPLIEEEARRCGQAFDRLQFRIQRGRWGSRSTRGTISLNAALLFLEPRLVRHVMIHELCHITHMNHSTQFKAALARWDPQWMTHEAQLKKSGLSLPAWIFAR